MQVFISNIANLYNYGKTRLFEFSDGERADN